MPSSGEELGAFGSSYWTWKILCDLYGKQMSKRCHPQTGRQERHCVLMPGWEYIVLSCAKSLQSCPPLCDPMSHSPPVSSVHRILQARTLEWVAMPSSRGSSRPRDKPASLMSPALADRFFTTSTTWEALRIYYIVFEPTQKVQDLLRI